MSINQQIGNIFPNNENFHKNFKAFLMHPWYLEYSEFLDYQPHCAFFCITEIRTVQQNFNLKDFLMFFYILNRLVQSHDNTRMMNAITTIMINSHTNPHGNKWPPALPLNCQGDGHNPEHPMNNENKKRGLEMLLMSLGPRPRYFFLNDFFFGMFQISTTIYQLQ